MYTIQQLERAVKNERKKNESILIDVMFTLIDIEEDIPFLEITKGRHSLQRLFNYKVCKAYYRPDYSLDEMNHINFDWFRPLNCHRHTPEEVEAYCKGANLTIERLHVEESGITVIARK